MTQVRLWRLLLPWICSVACVRSTGLRYLPPPVVPKKTVTVHTKKGRRRLKTQRAVKHKHKVGASEWPNGPCVRLFSRIGEREKTHMDLSCQRFDSFIVAYRLSFSSFILESSRVSSHLYLFHLYVSSSLLSPLNHILDAEVKEM